MRYKRITLLMIIFINSCTTNQILHSDKFIQYDCLTDENNNFFIYQILDKKRICILSPRKDIIQEIHKENHHADHLYSSNSEFLITGLDIAEKTNFSFLKNKKFVIFTNSTGVNSKLYNILEILLKLNLKPTLLLEPEHGVFGSEDTVSSEILVYDKKYEIYKLNLYSRIKRPPIEYLENIDTILIDIQNLPVRCYTYVSTLMHILEVADLLSKEVIILDRPHPYGIWKPKGSYLEEGYESFVSLAPVPFIYSMTPAEFVIFMSLYKYKNLKVKIIRMENFNPNYIKWSLDNTWINPSPNIPDFETSLVYPGLVFFEGTNISVGRGTTKPFIYSGAPWMDNIKILNEMRKLNLPGVKFGITQFRPTFSIYKGELCNGIQIRPISKDFDPIKTGYEYMRIIKKIHPEFKILSNSKNEYFMDKLWGSSLYRFAIENNLPYSEFEKLWEDDSEHFYEFTKDIRIYP